MPYLRTLLSALTFFGGHLLNRRLDRIVLILAVLAVVGIGSSMLLPNVLVNVAGGGLALWLLRTPMVLIVATAISSAALTWKDARLPAVAPLTAVTRAAGGIVSLLGLMVMSVALSSLLPSRESTIARPSQESEARITHPFYTSTLLGGHPATAGLRPPPAGPHALRGRILLDGKPIDNVELQLVLNEAFETDTLFTDDHGAFELSLPAGKWFINFVTVTGWNEAPEGRTLLLFSGFEPVMGPGYYSRWDLKNGAGLEITLPQAQGSDGPTFELRDAISVDWPSRTDLFESTAGRAAAADVAESVISWKAVSAAAEYEIQISSIRREDQSISYSPILRRRLTDTTLRLAELPQRPPESVEPSEYSIAIFAFDSAGKLLTETDRRRGELAFSLAGDVRLAKEPYASSPVPADRAEYFRNLERLSLVSGLLDYKQLDAARVILGDVTNDAPPGRKAALQGAIEALAGDCSAALPLFEKADAEGGSGCAPQKYRLLCEGR